ncbi:hypothetical protein JCM10207_007016 [Rhodosporidiobolus poonsookiae]
MAAAPPPPPVSSTLPPPPPPGALPPASTSAVPAVYPVTVPTTTVPQPSMVSYAPEHARTNRAFGAGAPLTPSIRPTPTRGAESEWRESSFISSFYGDNSVGADAACPGHVAESPTNDVYPRAPQPPRPPPPRPYPPEYAHGAAAVARGPAAPLPSAHAGGSRSPRASFDSSQFSLYSYHSDTSNPPPTAPSNGLSRSTSQTTFPTPYPPRKQSLEHLGTQHPPFESTTAPQAHSRFGSSLLAVDGASLSPQPTILMSPPLDGPPAPLPRNRSIDSNWSRAQSLSATSPSQPTFAPFASGSPSADLSRRPSYATLSPNASLAASDFFRSSGVDVNPGDSAYLDPALLSHLAVYLRDHVSRGPRLKGAIQHEGFTGEDIVSTLATALQARLPPSLGTSLGVVEGKGRNGRTAQDRKVALEIARALQQALFFYEVDWSDAPLKDAAGGGVYTFLQEGGTAAGDFDEDLPTGVVVSLAPCYSPLCGQLQAEGSSTVCYSPSCPNRRGNQLERVGSTLSAHSAAEPIEEADNWQTSVPLSVLEALSKQEIDRQNQIFELIQGEQEYCDDLEYIEQGFARPLREADPPILPPDRLAAFLSAVLLNISEIRDHSRRFLAALRSRQQAAPVVSGVGKIVFTAAVEWSQAYIDYTVQFPMADFVFKDELANNSRLQDLLMDFRKHPSAKRRGFDHYHNRATLRLLRYNLLLSQILKKTADDDAQAVQEREYIAQAIQLITQQGSDADRAIVETKNRVRLKELERDLVMRAGESTDLRLLDDSRRLFMAGKIYRRPEGAGLGDQFQEGYLVVLDNYLVITKAPRPDRDGRMRYVVNRRPVPLDLVQLKTSSFTEPPAMRSSGFHLRSNRSATATQPAVPSSASDPGALVYPFSFFQLGRFDGLVYLYVDSPAVRDEWERQLKAAISLRMQRQAAERVVRLDPLADATFGSASLTVGSLTAPSATSAPSNRFGKPTCSVPLQTADGLWLIIAGCAEGIFIGWRGRPKTMQQVVHLAGITQCAVLPDFSFLLVIANRVLVAYTLEALIPSKATGKVDQASKAPQRLSGQKDVSFFKVGKIGDTDPRTLVIYGKKSGVKESVFKALEPVNHAEKGARGGGGHRFLGLGSSRPEWFRTYKEFFMPSLVTGLYFQRSKLALIGSRGVEIMDLESMRTMTVPDFPPTRHDRALYTLAKRCEDASTLGMFRIADNKFLLVYTDFAFTVGRHGEPTEGPFIEFESKPEQVAYSAPYLFAVSPSVVEIRHVFTGRLVQFIVGSHMYLTYDGSGIPASPVLDARNGSHGAADELAGPVHRRLHLSIREQQYHALYELVVVA